MAEGAKRPECLPVSSFPSCTWERSCLAKLCFARTGRAFAKFHGRLFSRQEDIPPLLRLRHRADGGYRALRAQKVVQKRL
jgi:hypothetical protein